MAHGRAGAYTTTRRYGPRQLRPSRCHPVTDDRGSAVSGAPGAGVGLGEREELAEVAVFLASDESSFATGTGFVIDGGETASQTRPTRAEAFAGAERRWAPTDSRATMVPTGRASPWHTTAIADRRS
ncbi:SDR family oxidoreductase [Streptomyces sp. NPDC005077]|uniref:SDR family oxidoreductase n=1 Tax=Streptomyces sp. NPDC005077 TaxID=3154292 RepID=UPI0033B96DDD